jgi:rhodanese-related sulfurtransferase
LPGTLVIPINELFTEANLALIPTDKTVVVLCLSGTRATAAGTVVAGVKARLFAAAVVRIQA